MNKISERMIPRPRKAPSRPRPRTSDRLADAAVPPPAGDGKAARHDGWTPERQRIFLQALAECGVVEDAARAAGMSKQSAYAFRNRAAGRGFHLGWLAAQQQARHHLTDALMSRALHGCVELIYRDGKLWGERHRFDNRLTLALHTKLEEQARQGDQEGRVTRHVVEEFEEFLDRVGCGDEGAVADFVERRQAADRFAASKEGRLLRRLDRYLAEGAGLDPEADRAGRDEDVDDNPDEEFDDEEFDSEEPQPPTDDQQAGANEWQPSTSSTSPSNEPDPNREHATSAAERSAPAPSTPPRPANAANGGPAENGPREQRRGHPMDYFDHPDFDHRRWGKSDGGKPGGRMA